MKISTKNIVIGALLIGLAIIIPVIIPIKIVIPPFSATLFSHVPLILAMFINPAIAVCVALGSAIGFIISLGPIVAARAAMHVFFVFVGAYMVKKNRNIYIIAFVTMIIHSVSDMLIVYLLHIAGLLELGSAMSTVQYIIAVGTSVHHLVVFAIALVIYAAVRKASKAEIFRPLRFKW